MSEESKRVKYLLQYWSHLQLAREYEKLENIIKEVREYFDDLEIFAPSRDIKYDILEILDKGE